MSTVHVYTAEHQPARRYWDPYLAWWITTPYWHRAWCSSCGRRQYVRHLVVQVYYDDVRVFCAPGHGCAALAAAEPEEREP